jgi:hypothetical protein
MGSQKLLIVFLESFKEPPVYIAYSYVALFRFGNLFSTQEDPCLTGILLISFLASPPEEINYYHDYYKNDDPDKGIPESVARF